MINVVWDMETNDPDDFLTLLFLLGHPCVSLKAVTILPGSPEQIGLVRQALQWFKRDLPIGVHNINTTKQCVSPWHTQAYGSITPSRDALPAADVLLKHCDANTTLLTGAALTNVRSAIISGTAAQQPFMLARLVAQGGFAGEGVVPPDLQLDKFKGLAVSPTYNLIGDNRAAQAVLSHSGIEERFFVAKNVCHRVYYDQTMHNIVEVLRQNSLSLDLIWQGMDVYLKDNPAGKMLHDPLAACCAIDSSIGTWVEVELYRDGNAWGSRPASNSHTYIIIDYDHDRFVSLFTEHSA